MKLTDKEKELIVSCLLYVSCADVCIDLTDEESRKLVKIAEKIGIEDVKHAYVYGEPGFLDKLGITETLFENFNIRHQKV